jgi:hypothetical protein
MEDGRPVPRSSSKEFPILKEGSGMEDWKCEKLRRTIIRS